MFIKEEFTPFLIGILVFISMFLFTIAISIYSHQRSKQRNILIKIKQAGEDAESSQNRSSSPGVVSVIRGRIMGVLSWVGERLKTKDQEELSHIRLNLLKGGFRKSNDLFIFWGIKYFLAILLPVCFIIFNKMTLAVVHHYMAPAITIYLALMGFYLPNLILKLKISGRRTRMMRGLPDALDLMVVCVEAGMGLDASISRVAEEMKLTNKVLSEEFGLLTLELRAGKMRRDALRNLAVRNDLEDLNSLMTILIQTDKFGTSVVQALKVYSDTLRTRRYQKAEEIAAKLQVKLIFPVILFIFPSLFVVLAGPAAIQIYRVILKK